MGPIGIAISDLKYRIPPRILEVVFIKRVAWGREAPVSIDEQIMALVVRPRVLVDCNLVGGAEVYLPINGADHERQNDYTSVYRFSKQVTQGRSIMSALNVTFTDPNRVSGYGQIASCQNSSLMQAGQAMMNTHAAMPVTSTAKVQLIGENTVMVRDTIVLPPNVFMRCIVSNDENMSHLQIKSYRAFCKLMELAVKSYIYNTYTIELDMGEIHAGQTIGKFKDKIDEWADAEELYQDFLTTKWQKISVMNDNESYSRLLRTQFDGYR